MDEESLEKTSNGQRDVSDVKIEFETIHVHTSDSERVAAEPISHIAEMDVGWLFGFNGPLRQYFSLYRAISQKEGERGERIDESKNVQTTPTRTYCKRNRPLPYSNQNCRTPRHWMVGWLVLGLTAL